MLVRFDRGLHQARIAPQERARAEVRCFVVGQKILLPLAIVRVAEIAEIGVRWHFVPDVQAAAHFGARLCADRAVRDLVDEHGARLEQQHHAGPEIAAVTRAERRARAHDESLQTGERKLPIRMRRVELLAHLGIGVAVVEILQRVPERVVIRRRAKAAVSSGSKKIAMLFFSYCGSVASSAKARHGVRQRRDVLAVDPRIEHLAALFRLGAEEAWITRVHHVGAQALVRRRQPVGQRTIERASRRLGGRG